MFGLKRPETFFTEREGLHVHDPAPMNSVYVIQRNSCRKLASAVKEAGAEALLSWYLLREDAAKSIDNMVHSIAKLQRLEKTCEAVGVLKVASTVLEKKLHFSIGDVAIAALQFYKELPLDEDERRDPVFRLEPGSLEPAGLSDEGEGMFPRDLSPLRWCVRAEMESATAAVCICWSRCHASNETSKLRRVS